MRGEEGVNKDFLREWCLSHGTGGMGLMGALELWGGPQTFCRRREDTTVTELKVDQSPESQGESEMGRSQVLQGT